MPDTEYILLITSPRDKLCRNNSFEQFLERVSFQKRDILKSKTPILGVNAIFQGFTFLKRTSYLCEIQEFIVFLKVPIQNREGLPLHLP